MLSELSKYWLDLDSFNIIYIAPMKALAQQMDGNFSSCLSSSGINVRDHEDAQMTAQQIAESQIIIMTLEKCDVITHKSTDTSYTNFVRRISRTLSVDQF